MDGEWVWGNHVHVVPNISNYSNFGIEFAYNVAWGLHVKKVIEGGKTSSVLSNHSINLNVRRLLLLDHVQTEYEREIWEFNKVPWSTVYSFGWIKHHMHAMRLYEVIWG